MKGKVRTGWQLVMKPHYKGKAWRLNRRKVLKVEMHREHHAKMKVETRIIFLQAQDPKYWQKTATDWEKDIE